MPKSYGPEIDALFAWFEKRRAARMALGQWHGRMPQDEAEDDTNEGAAWWKRRAMHDRINVRSEMTAN